MLKLLKNRCSFCSKPVDKTHAARAHSTPSHEAVGSSKSKSEWSERGPTPPRPGVEPIERNPDNNPKTTSRGRRMPVIPRARSLSRAPLSPQEPRCFSSFFRARPPPLRATPAKLPRNNRSAAPPCRKTNGYAFAPPKPPCIPYLEPPAISIEQFRHMRHFFSIAEDKPRPIQDIFLVMFSLLSRLMSRIDPPVPQQLDPRGNLLPNSGRKLLAAPHLLDKAPVRTPVRTPQILIDRCL